MTIKSPSINERGFAHVGLILLAIVVIGVGVFAFTRVQNANDKSSNTSASQPAAANEDEQAAKDSAKLNGAEQEADKAPAQANDQEVTENVTQ
jgi:uncharacterized protein HemX